MRLLNETGLQIYSMKVFTIFSPIANIVKRKVPCCQYFSVCFYFVVFDQAIMTSDIFTMDSIFPFLIGFVLFDKAIMTSDIFTTDSIFMPP